MPFRFKDHVYALKNIDDVYKKFFWPTHRETCKKVLNENIEIIRQTEVEFGEKITKLTLQFFQAQKIKVDITYYGMATTWNPKHRAYTSIFPIHVVMNVEGENEIMGNWLEVLYHESTHELILGKWYFVGGTIQDVSEVIGVKIPRQLDHAYHFYITGELTKEILKKKGILYERTYMQQEGVFSRYYATIEKPLNLYMKREITLEEATKKMLQDLK